MKYDSTDTPIGGQSVAMRAPIKRLLPQIMQLTRTSLFQRHFAATRSLYKAHVAVMILSVAVRDWREFPGLVILIDPDVLPALVKIMLKRTYRHTELQELFLGTHKCLTSAWKWVIVNFHQISHVSDLARLLLL